MLGPQHDLVDLPTRSFHCLVQHWLAQVPPVGCSVRCRPSNIVAAAHEPEWRSIGGLVGKRQLNHLGGHARSRLDRCARHCHSCTHIA